MHRDFLRVRARGRRFATIESRIETKNRARSLGLTAPFTPFGTKTKAAAHLFDNTTMQLPVFSDHELMLFKVAAQQGHGLCVVRQPIPFAYQKQHDDIAIVFTSYNSNTEPK